VKGTLMPSSSSLNALCRGLGQPFTYTACLSRGHSEMLFPAVFTNFTLKAAD